jgi:hypothetical protein
VIQLPKERRFGPIELYTHQGGFWLRVFGRGLSVQDRRVLPAMFSERNGYRRVLRIGPWAIEPLSRKPRMIPEDVEETLPLMLAAVRDGYWMDVDCNWVDEPTDSAKTD